jgi:hypothetical protein
MKRILLFVYFNFPILYIFGLLKAELNAEVVTKTKTEVVSFNYL